MNPGIKSWLGKRVWVIGASTGIGAETALLLLKKGAHVALSSRTEKQLQVLVQNQPNALAIAADVTDHASLIHAHRLILEAWDKLDLVLVVAGGYNEMRADSFDLAAANRLLDLNLRGVYNCLDAVLPSLLKQGHGGIGIVGSVAGFSGLPKALVYGPTKAAIVNLCESLYFDLRPKNIAVYLVSPGFVETPLTANNDFKMPALISASTAAQELVAGMERGEFHIHFPKRFTNWLRLMRMLPYRCYFFLVHKFTGL
ncbi:SDR family NAD(P)-dependent oxidoreductase [Undibacterium terreum]|uniref:Oxidoreductase n=1 Tax=Undibacterium terreum TaxID=1224302 RepID=A0A916UV35_9BURK|nr:SDR family NAD(P)-dependent oxidoreductase [Undibacterium terreum]GGC88494.1 oxidoreductase [Undibacterium terreum]